MPGDGRRSVRHSTEGLAMRVTRSAVSLGGDIGMDGFVRRGRPIDRWRPGPSRFRSRRNRTPWRSVTRSSTGSGCRTTRAATAAMGSGRYTTIRPASPATMRAAAAVRGRSVRTSTSSTPRAISGCLSLEPVRAADSTLAGIDRPADRCPRRIPDQPDGRAAQVRYRPEL